MLNKKILSRRDLVKRSSTPAGATAATLDIARSAHAADDETIRTALVGCGGRGAGAAADCLSVPRQIKLVAVADAFEDRARSAFKVLTRQFVDKVDVPPGFRPIHHRAAIEAGTRVFTEKPYCVDAPVFPFASRRTVPVNGYDRENIWRKTT